MLMKSSDQPRMGPPSSQFERRPDQNYSSCQLPSSLNSVFKVDFKKLHWSFQITYKPTVALNKISILLLYLRIMPQQMYRIMIFSLLTLVSLFCVATSIAGVFQCVPVQKAWHKGMKTGHCYNLVAAWYSNAVFSIVTDFVILALPMHMVYKLQSDKREKVILYFIFGIGGL